MGGATLVSRRFGPSVGGIITALPVVTGSVAFYVALEQGAEFASRTAASSVIGISAVGWFCLAYAHASRRAGWPASLAVGYAAFGAGLLPIVPFEGVSGIVGFLFVVVTLVVAFRLLPPSTPGAAARPPSWDIPGRIGTATAVVVLVTALAAPLGPAGSGLLAAFPSIFAVMLVFTHRHEGQPAAIEIIRGFVTGLVACSLFLAIAADTIVPYGIWLGFSAATVACLGFQAIAMRVVHTRTRGASGLDLSLEAPLT